MEKFWASTTGLNTVGGMAAAAPGRAATTAAASAITTSCRLTMPLYRTLV
jgi:hypothetical protein